MGISSLLIAVLTVYSYLLLVRVILSWVNPRPTNELLLMVVKVTEPVLAPLRKVASFGGFDFSPILAYLLISILVRIISSTGI